MMMDNALARRQVEESRAISERVHTPSECTQEVKNKMMVLETDAEDIDVITFKDCSCLSYGAGRQAMRSNYVYKNFDQAKDEIISLISLKPALTPKRYLTVHESTAQNASLALAWSNQEMRLRLMKAIANAAAETMKTAFINLARITEEFKIEGSWQHYDNKQDLLKRLRKADCIVIDAPEELARNRWILFDFLYPLLDTVRSLKKTLYVGSRQPLSEGPALWQNIDVGINEMRSIKDIYMMMREIVKGNELSLDSGTNLEKAYESSLK